MRTILISQRGDCERGGVGGGAGQHCAAGGRTQRGAHLGQLEDGAEDGDGEDNLEGDRDAPAGLARDEVEADGSKTNWVRATLVYSSSR